jgi:hypothetical protein
VTDPPIIARAGEKEIGLLPALANRHGCITGATGTGKTVTPQNLAENFSRIGVPAPTGLILGSTPWERRGKRPSSSGASTRRAAPMTDSGFWWTASGHAGSPKKPLP